MKKIRTYIILVVCIITITMVSIVFYFSSQEDQGGEGDVLTSPETIFTIRLIEEDVNDVVEISPNPGYNLIHSAPNIHIKDDLNFDGRDDYAITLGCKTHPHFPNGSYCIYGVFIQQEDGNFRSVLNQDDTSIGLYADDIQLATSTIVINDKKWKDLFLIEYLEVIRTEGYGNYATAHKLFSFDGKEYKKKTIYKGRAY